MLLLAAWSITGAETVEEARRWSKAAETEEIIYESCVFTFTRLCFTIHDSITLCNDFKPISHVEKYHDTLTCS